MTRNLVIALGCACSLASAIAGVQVNETGCKVLLRGAVPEVLLAVDNTASEAAPARIDLEWLDTAGVVRASKDTVATLTPGANSIRVPMELIADSAWYRLRYSVRVAGEESKGILPLAHISDDLFELRILSPFFGQPGATYEAIVQAVQPVSGTPVAGVRVQAKLDLDNPVDAIGVTGSDGTAHLRFEVPADASDDEADLTVRGSLSQFSQEVEAEVRFENHIKIGITTDKPLYQPGQTLHIRALCFTPTNRAAADAKVMIRVEDPDETRMFVSHGVTTRFGVASADWQIPDNARLGDYSIVVEIEGEKEQRQTSKVKISRYDLPNFTVTVKPDRSYYLPGQDALVEVHGDYLFGKPVPRGRVRVVRESERKWDFGAQKWDVTEEEKYEGLANTAGRITLRIPLAKMHAELAEKDSKRFQDLNFTAYVRDLSSNRTEQRRFDLRVTRDAVHIYLSARWGRHDYYVSTSYANGRPAQCRIFAGGKQLATTNKYGVARIEIPKDSETVNLAAVDGQGAKGRLEDRIYGNELPVHIRTDRTLYRPGESVRVQIVSDEPRRGVPLQVIHDRTLLASWWLDLSSRNAELQVPWRPEFVNEVTFAVSTDERQGVSKTVIFPRDTELKLDVRPGRATYRPGEAAAVGLQMLSPAGAPVEGVFGMSIVDSAVTERARTDEESTQRRRFGGWDWLRPGFDDEFAGVKRRDLYALDSSKPFDADLDLLAEVMLANDSYWPRLSSSMEYAEALQQAFGPIFAVELRVVKEALDAGYASSGAYVRDVAALRKLLADAGIDLEALRDPWGTPYRVEFKTEGKWDELLINSAGPDKKFGTEDDLVAHTTQREYFRPTHDRIEKVFAKLPAFPSTESAARKALLAAGINVDDLRDPWGKPYRVNFRIVLDQAFLRFTTEGPGQRNGTIDVDGIGGPYFSDTQREINDALAKVKSWPHDEREWNVFLKLAGLFPIRDAWRRPVYATFREQALTSDVIKHYTAAKYGAASEIRTVAVPVVARYYRIMLRSAGPDGVAGNMDDFDLAAFSQTVQMEEPEPSSMQPQRPGEKRDNTGSIVGKVVDPRGMGISSATIKAVREGQALRSGTEFTTQAGPDGSYVLDGLLAQRYDVRITSPGFQMFMMSGVPVQVKRATIVDATLNLGTVSEMVTVEAEPLLLQTQVSSLALNSRSAMMVLSPGVATAKNPERATPRLREYFPETLLWAPSVETGPDGRAELKFKLADNITTWKVEVTGSTETGDIGTATADIRAFQPFFVDHDPPRILTQGDELQLPVTVRNYLDRAQDVSLTIKPEDWFRIAGAQTVPEHIGAGTSANAVFDITAVKPVTDGKQRLTATSVEAGDAIEKPLTVHPDGREVAESVNALLASEASLAANVPRSVIEGSIAGELKIYPNIGSHILDSIEGILHRPYGCGEQTISSTYTNLLLLEHLKSAGIKRHPLAEKARRYLQAGYDRLLRYQADSGGFTYWGTGDADLALTAYALRFLTDAAEFIDVNEEVVESARKWLASRQRPDGSWEYDSAYIAMALPGAGSADPAVKRALEFLRKDTGNDPYSIAAFALAARRAGLAKDADQALDRLRALVRHEGDLAYWNLEGNTPFHGWGRAGQVETTALVLRAILGSGRTESKPLIDGSLLFLMRNTDSYGVWYSGQATVQVLQAMSEAAARYAAEDAGAPIDVVVNGKAVAQLTAPPRGEIATPLRMDVSQWLRAGANRIDLKRGGGSPAQAQLSISYYVPWTKQPAGPASSAIQLSVAFDRTSAKPGESVTCRVKAQRLGSRTYGMLLAEIGLPPGVDVDRHSLENAMEKSGWTLNHFDILPDRVVAYLWPPSGGTNFEFQLKPRFSMKAKTAPSTMYDYYNPDASVTVAPVEFSVGH
jgi:hypothetical protein